MPLFGRLPHPLRACIKLPASKMHAHPCVQVLRASLLFVWKDNNGRVWREVIRESARKEYESARHAWAPSIKHAILAARGSFGKRSAGCALATLFWPSAVVSFSCHFRFEQDGETINRLLVTGRDCLDQSLAKARDRSSAPRSA